MPTAIAPGITIGGEFVLQRALKSGGFGTVFEARHVRTSQRRAVKIIHSKAGGYSEKLVERFRVESSAAGQIASEHVVQVINAGFDQATGSLWIAMEYLVGSDLADWMVRNGRMAAPQARMILQHVCHALAAAHRVSIVHRDLKPENVFLAESARVGEPLIAKVLDFGIAKVVRDVAKTTEPIGTWAWLAPEQAAPGQSVRPATDVWSLGLLGFYLLTGQLYWLSFQPGAQINLMQELTQRTFERAALRAHRLGCGHLIPPGFDAWFARCVSHDNRFQNATEAYDALGSFQPIQTQYDSVEPNVVEPLPPTRRRPSGATVAVAGIGALLAAGAIGAAVARLFAETSGSSRSNGADSRLVPKEPTMEPKPALTAVALSELGPACLADSSRQCWHVDLAAGAGLSVFLSHARRLRSEQGLCSEIHRGRDDQVAQFWFAVCVPRNWRAPDSWLAAGVVPETKIPVPTSDPRPSFSGDPIFPPPCAVESLSFTSQSGTVNGAAAAASCGAAPPPISSVRGDLWSWPSAGGVCRCREETTLLARLQSVSECLLLCGQSDKACAASCGKQ